MNPPCRASRSPLPNPSRPQNQLRLTCLSPSCPSFQTSLPLVRPVHVLYGDAAVSSKTAVDPVRMEHQRWCRGPWIAIGRITSPSLITSYMQLSLPVCPFTYVLSGS